MVRNTLKYVANKDMKAFATDLKTIYTAPDEKTAFYTTNALGSLNSCYRRLNKQKSVFPSPSSLMKALYLAIFEATKKWTIPIRNWGKVRGELSIMYAGRLID